MLIVVESSGEIIDGRILFIISPKLICCSCEYVSNVCFAIIGVTIISGIAIIIITAKIIIAAERLFDFIFRFIWAYIGFRT